MRKLDYLKTNGQRQRIVFTRTLFDSLLLRSPFFRLMDVGEPFGRKGEERCAVLIPFSIYIIYMYTLCCTVSCSCFFVTLKCVI